MPDSLPKPVVPPRFQDHGDPVFFRDPAIDRLIETVMAIGSELWIQRDRMRVIEKLLAQHGAVTAEMIEQYKDDEAGEAERKAARDQMVKRLYDPLTKISGRSEKGA